MIHQKDSFLFRVCALFSIRKETLDSATLPPILSSLLSPPFTSSPSGTPSSPSTISTFFFLVVDNVSPLSYSLQRFYLEKLARPKNGHCVVNDPSERGVTSRSHTSEDLSEFENRLIQNGVTPSKLLMEMEEQDRQLFFLLLEQDLSFLESIGALTFDLTFHFQSFSPSSSSSSSSSSSLHSSLSQSTSLTSARCTPITQSSNPLPHLLHSSDSQSVSLSLLHSADSASREQISLSPSPLCFEDPSLFFAKIHFFFPSPSFPSPFLPIPSNFSPLPIIELLKSDLKLAEKERRRELRKRFTPHDHSDSLRRDGWRHEWDKGRKERIECYLKSNLEKMEEKAKDIEKEKEKRVGGEERVGGDVLTTPRQSHVTPSADRKIDRLKGALKFSSKGFSFSFTFSFSLSPFLSANL